MSVAQQLSALQDLDLEIDRLSAQLVAVRAAQGETETLREAKAAWQRDEADLDKKRRIAQDQEWDVKDIQAKIAPLETKLYSGKVTSAKDLTNLQREVESLKARQSTLDERLLEALIAVEEGQGRTKSSRDHLAQVEAAWQSDQARLHTEEATLQQQVAALQERRQAQAATLDPASLSIYQRLRQTKAGRAVARLEGIICQGCRLSLPSGDAVRAKQATELVFCVNCGRILCR